MNIFNTLHRSILVLFAVVVLSIVTLVHFSISKIVAEQSRAQQQTISPAISLITEQLLKPLHISQALGKSGELKNLMQNSNINSEEIFNFLDRLKSEFNLTFFVALESSRVQYNSDGTIVPLVEDQVDWYFKYKDEPKNEVADIGKWEDTHFYIDIKVFDDNDKFLGFFGIGKSLVSFIEIFDEYKQQFGYDFIFVGPNGDIMLSSDANLNATNSEFSNIADLDWYAELMDSAELENFSVNNALVEIKGDDYLIAQIDLKRFDWTMYLLSPLETRQTDISRGFVASVITLLVVIFVLFLVIYNLLYYFHQDLKKPKLEIDSGFINSTDKIQQLLVTEQYTNPAYLAFIRLDINDDVAQQNFALLSSLTSKTSYLLNNLIEAPHEIGKCQDGFWISLIQSKDMSCAMSIAQNIRHSVATLEHKINGEKMLITCSIALVEVDSTTIYVDSINKAVTQLKEMQEFGGNQVTLLN